MRATIWMSSKAVPPRNKPSTLQDILAGRKTEVDIFAGAVIRLGKEYGVPTPYNEFLYPAIRVLEAKERRYGRGSITSNNRS